MEDFNQAKRPLMIDARQILNARTIFIQVSTESDLSDLESSKRSFKLQTSKSKIMQNYNSSSLQRFSVTNSDKRF